MDGDLASGFNDSVNISENSDFPSQYDPFYIILQPFIVNTFLLAYTQLVQGAGQNRDTKPQPIDL